MEAPQLERKLVAIFAADVAGYSRMMEHDEEGTLATLSSHREIVDEVIAHYRGRVAGTAGDSVLAEFASVTDAVNAAVEIQKSLAEENQQLPDDRQMHFRIGINVGDVMLKDGDIFGDGVNIAARLESLAEPGGICVSRGVRDHLRNKIPAKFDDLGEQSVKNIAQPIRVFRVRYGEGTASDEPTPPPTEPGPVVPDEVEIAFWDTVKSSVNSVEYRAYLDRYPEGAFAALAHARIDSLEAGDAAGTASPAPAANAVDPKTIELAYWDTVSQSDNVDMFRAYLDQYPEGAFVALAHARIASFEAAPAEPAAPAPPLSGVDPKAIELAYWDAVAQSDNIEMFQAYLDQYPEGEFAALAQARIASFDSTGQSQANNGAGNSGVDPKAIEMAFWDSVKESANTALFQAYLDKYPHGEFVAIAEVKLIELRPNS